MFLIHYSLVLIPNLLEDFLEHEGLRYNSLDVGITGFVRQVAIGSTDKNFKSILNESSSHTLNMKFFASNIVLFITKFQFK
jgi:hypothetical protein